MTLDLAVAATLHAAVMTTSDRSASGTRASGNSASGTTASGTTTPGSATPGTANRGAAIAVAGLHKSFGDHHVLRGVDLTVPAGTVYALLGPNGAGKTTMVNILSTLLTADSGEVRVAGHDVRREPSRVRSTIGVTGQFSAIDMFLTGRENLRLMADLSHLDRRSAVRDVAALLDRFDLVEAADRQVLNWSGGMQRRLDLAMTLITRPRLVFLDEPTTGLDPRSRREVWDVVREQVADGVTVLLTTQYLEEADALADRVGVLDAGTLVAEGTSAELKALVPGDSTNLDDVFLALTGHAASATEPADPDGPASPTDPTDPSSLADTNTDKEATAR